MQFHGEGAQNSDPIVAERKSKTPGETRRASLFKNLPSLRT
jgi:hypothetical protein